MITAKEARNMAKKAHEGINKHMFDAVREKVFLAITSEADTGHCGTLFSAGELVTTVGIELVIDELRENGFEVTVHRNMYHRFESMYVRW